MPSEAIEPGVGPFGWRTGCGLAGGDLQYRGVDAGPERRDVGLGHPGQRKARGDPLRSGRHAGGDDRCGDRAAAPEVVVVADRADRTTPAVEHLEVEDPHAALACRHDQVRPLRAGTVVRCERVLDHVLVEVGVADREHDGLDLVRLAVDRPALSVQRERVRTGRVADPDVRIERERVEPGHQDLPYAGREPGARDAAGGVFEGSDQVGAFRRTEAEVGLPLAQGQGHGDARPVQAAVIGGWEGVGSVGRVLGAMGRRTPEGFALRVDESCGGLPVGDRAEQAVEERHLAVEAGAAEDLGRDRRAAGDAVVETLLLDRPGDGLVEAAGERGRLDGSERRTGPWSGRSRR